MKRSTGSAAAEGVFMRLREVEMLEQGVRRPFLEPDVAPSFCEGSAVAGGPDGRDASDRFFGFTADQVDQPLLHLGHRLVGLEDVDLQLSPDGVDLGVDAVDLGIEAAFHGLQLSPGAVDLAVKTGDVAPGRGLVLLRAHACSLSRHREDGKGRRAQTPGRKCTAIKSSEARA